jgi:uncharacterized protein GlcG (DUF336 family)
MDQARVTSIDVAINKAFTAACARRATHEYAKVAGAGGPAFGIQSSNQERFMIAGGGLPIFIKGTIAGGVGCSSGSPEQDREVAQAGIDGLMTTLGELQGQREGKLWQVGNRQGERGGKNAKGSDYRGLRT